MKKTLLIVTTALLSGFSFAQGQIENPGFEGAWQDVAGAEDEPIEWSSLKTADAWTTFAPVVAFQETGTPHSGTYCIKLVNGPLTFGVVPNGIMTNGQVHADLDPELGYVSTITSNADWNTPFTDRPDSLVGWFKYTPTSTDKGKVEVLLHDDTQTGKLPEATAPQPNWVGKARYNVTTSTTTWVRFSVPFNYFNNNTPDYILVVLTSGDSTQAEVGSTMYIDDLELIYNPLLVDVTPSATQNIDMGVNGTTLTVNATPNAAVVSPITQEWKYSTTSGSGYVSFGTPETGTTYTPNFAAAGIYYVVCEVDFGTQVVTSNEVEIVVTDPGSNSVTISPSATQNILANTNGTTMTATESPSAASSREWQYSTTSGSGYVSFGTPETGTTYTPNFASVGTYYIICESDFAGDIQISNEVTIMVPSAAGIDQDNLQFNIYSTSNGIKISLSDFDSNTTFKLFTLDGKEVYTSFVNAENTLHPVNLSGVFVYQIIKGDRVITGKIQL
ncbi:MAG: PCMD domain-containing protein [Crocinitomicaceae bacterium]|nr:PCMD domain-containing protein [Crocinitomicaceae bacterium]MBK8924451.1 PCMD domain-containing protein [Crocinitomicaceae bacterium]